MGWAIREGTARRGAQISRTVLVVCAARDFSVILCAC